MGKKYSVELTEPQLRFLIYILHQHIRTRDDSIPVAKRILYKAEVQQEIEFVYSNN